MGLDIDIVTQITGIGNIIFRNRKYHIWKGIVILILISSRRRPNKELGKFPSRKRLIFPELEQIAKHSTKGTDILFKYFDIEQIEFQNNQ